MNRNQVQKKAQNDMPDQPGSRWFATLAGRLPFDLPGYDGRFVGGNGQSRTLYLGSEADHVLPACAVRADCSLIFDGALFNHGELRDELGEFPTPAGNDAELVLAGYARWGEDFLSRLRGRFAVIIWDSKRETLLGVRDPLGSHPLFYADGRDELLFSPSIEILLRQSAVSSALNRPALVDHLLDRYPKLEETCYEAVKRVPPGHVLRIRHGDRKVFRYWDPAPNGEVKWLTADDIEQFDHLLDRAVSRCLQFGPAGVFLSGGLDSVSVAAVTAAQCSAEGLRKPWALSLIFPDPLSNEEVVQRGVAAQLELPQVVKPFFEATGPQGLLGPALALSNSLSAPLMNTWLPAYYELALEGKRRGCQTILTGGGGDEWLTVSPFLAADLLRDFDLAGVYRLWHNYRRSFRRSSLTLAWSLLWRFGAKPLLLPRVHKFVEETAPWALRLRHRLSFQPAPWISPDWLAPDPALRLEFEHRREEEHANQGQTSESFYIRDIRPALEHAVVSWEQEEVFEVYQRLGMRMLQPYWDADLIDMLYRTPPFLLMQDGRSKGLVRGSVARRFPSLGFERQRKVEATSFYSSLIYRDASVFWQQFGGARTLAELGIIDKQILSPMIERLLAGRQEGANAHRVWSVLNLESWTRSHVS